MPPRVFLELEVFGGRRGRRHYDIVKEVAAVDENGQTVLHLIVRPPREVPADVELNRDRWTRYHHLSWDFAPVDSIDYDEAERILKNFGNSDVMVYSTFGVATPYIRSLGFPVKIEDSLRLRPAQGCAFHPETVYCALARAQLAVSLHRRLWFPALMDPMPATLGEQQLLPETAQETPLADTPRKENAVADAPRETTAAYVPQESPRDVLGNAAQEDPAQNTATMDTFGRILRETILALNSPVNSPRQHVLAPVHTAVNPLGVAPPNGGQESRSGENSSGRVSTSNFDNDQGLFSPFPFSPIDFESMATIFPESPMPDS